MNIQQKIENCLQRFTETDDYKTAGKELFLNITGAELATIDDNYTSEEFIKEFKREDRIPNALKKSQKLFTENIEEIHLVQQLQEDNVKKLITNKNTFNNQTNPEHADSFLFFIVRMRPHSSGITRYRNITREINRSFNVPAFILFCRQQSYDHTISLSFIDRRQHKYKSELDVLDKEVPILYNISCTYPHQVYLEKIANLHIPTCLQNILEDQLNLDGLVKEWLNILYVDKQTDSTLQYLQRQMISRIFMPMIAKILKSKK